LVPDIIVPCKDDVPEWASLDWVIATAGGSLDPAFGICALETDRAAKHKERRNIICGIFLILVLSISDEK
jgi:hypothetical protein